MASVRVTALIDTYNYGQFIEEAVDSVLNQDVPAEELEILVVDDGSTDDTRERVAKYGERVRYLYKPNGGQASAFNFGIARASGEIVALLDADDYWLPGKLRRVREEFEKHPEAGLVYHAFRELRTATKEWREAGINAVSGNVPGDKTKMLLYTATQTSGLSFRTRFLRDLLPLNEAMTIQADGLLAALIIFLAPVVAIAEPLAVYRIHGANLYFQSNNVVDKERQRRRIATLRVILDEMDKWLVEHGQDLRKPEILAFRTRWQILYESEEFQVDSPGRVKFAWHLLRAMVMNHPCVNARIQAMNVLIALRALFFGYEDYQQVNARRAGHN